MFISGFFMKLFPGMLMTFESPEVYCHISNWLLYTTGDTLSYFKLTGVYFIWLYRILTHLSIL